MKNTYAVLLVVMSMLSANILLVQAEEGTIKASSAWQGQGQFFQVREKQALFVGAFSGIMFVETKQGTLDAAKIVCPGMVEVNLNDREEGLPEVTEDVESCQDVENLGCIGRQQVVDDVAEIVEDPPPFGDSRDDGCVVVVCEDHGR